MAAVGIRPAALRIEYSDTHSGSAADKKKRATDWKRGCKSLAKALGVGGGPWGTGIFSSTSCYRRKSRLSGPDAAAAPWVLTVKDGDAGISWSLMKDGEGLVEINLPPTKFAPAFLVDEEYIDLLVFTLLERLPVAMYLPQQASPRPRLTLRHWRAGQASDFKYSVPEPAEELIVYGLRFDEERKLWRSTVYGRAKRVAVEPPTGRKKGKRQVLGGGGAVYELDAGALAGIAAGGAWAHDIEGPGSRGEQLDGFLRSAHGELDTAATEGKLQKFMVGGGSVLKKLLRAAASGYFGVRYGLQVLPAGSQLGELLGKTSIFGLLFEMRAGPLKGLRYYYDTMPKKTADFEMADGTNFEAQIKFSRHVLGYSFGFDPGILINRITIDPKIGLWTFYTDLPLAFDAQGKVIRTQEFEVNRALSPAVEVGAELLGSVYTVRGWYAVDVGYSTKKDGNTVSSNRVGLDGYLALGPKIPVLGLGIKTTILAFYYFESVAIKDNSERELQPGEAVIDELKYDGAYAGAGLALSW